MCGGNLGIRVSPWLLCAVLTLDQSRGVSFPLVPPPSHHILEDNDNNYKQITFGDMHCVPGVTLSSWELQVLGDFLRPIAYHIDILIPVWQKRKLA